MSRQYEWDQRMAEWSVAEVARHVIAHVVESNPPQWENYPDIGEHGWAAVEKEVARQLRRLAAQREKYDSAYSHLAQRATTEVTQ